MEVLWRGKSWTVVNGGFFDVKYTDVLFWRFGIWHGASFPCLSLDESSLNDVPYVCSSPMLVGYTLDISHLFHLIHPIFQCLQWIQHVDGEKSCTSTSAKLQQRRHRTPVFPSFQYCFYPEGGAGFSHIFSIELLNLFSIVATLQRYGVRGFLSSEAESGARFFPPIL